MSKAIVSYAVGLHEQLLDIAWPSFVGFARRHGWDLYRASKHGKDRPPAWYKLQAILGLLPNYDEVLLLDADTIIVDGREDLTAPEWAWQAMVRHRTGDGDVPNTGVWLCRKPMLPVIEAAWNNTKWLMHGWWEQAALLDLMGYHVEAPCHQVTNTELYQKTYFLDPSWNVHKWHEPAAERHRIQHATMWPDRVAVMQEWAREADGWLNE